MFIIYSLVIGIILGLITGGDIRNLVSRSFMHIWIVVFSFALQAFIFSDLLSTRINAVTIVILHILSYVFLLTFVFLNKKIHGVLVIGIGIFLNSLVIFLNKGYMPTFSENLANTSMAKHAQAIASGDAVRNSIGITEGTLLPWLGDIFHIPAGIPFSNVFSIGDVIIGIGVCIYFIYNMKPVKKNCSYL